VVERGHVAVLDEPTQLAVRLQALFPELVNQQPAEPSAPTVSFPREAMNRLRMLPQR